jgi:hypothetical protein
VVQVGGDLGFTLEACQNLLLACGSLDDLDRQVALQSWVLGEIHHTHSARPKQALDIVAADFSWLRGRHGTA